MLNKRCYPYGFCLPMAIAVAALFGAQTAALKLSAAVFAAQFFSLGAPDAFRRAAGRLISRRKLVGAGIFALILTALAAGAGQLSAPWIAKKLTLTLPETRYWLGAAAALTGLRCVEELFAAQGDQVSAQLSDLLGCIVLGAAMLIFYDDPQRARACCCCAIGVLTLSLAIAAFFSRGERPQLNITALKETPAAWLRELLYPALSVGFLLLMETIFEHFEIQPEALAAGFSIGWTVTLLCRTTFRRSAAESAAFNGWMTLAAALVGIGFMAMELSGRAVDPNLVRLIWLAIFCAMALYGAISPRTIAGLVLLLAALAGDVATAWAGRATALPMTGVCLAVGGVAAALCMIPDWRLMHRRARAERIRKRAHLAK